MRHCRKLGRVNTVEDKGRMLAVSTPSSAGAI
jgi:hypothetical protein